YSPMVTVNTESCGSYSYTGSIQVVNSLPYFGGYTYLGISQTTVCPGQEVAGWTQDQFSGYAWDFGNGNTDNGPQVYWDYSSVGNYNVTLTVTNGCGVDTVITEVVNVNNTT